MANGAIEFRIIPGEEKYSKFIVERIERRWSGNQWKCVKSVETLQEARNLVAHLTSTVYHYDRRGNLLDS